MLICRFAKEIERLPEVFAKPLVKEGSRMALLDPSSAPTKVRIFVCSLSCTDYVKPSLSLLIFLFRRQVDPNAAPRLQPFARDDKYLKAAFKEIAKLYGGEDNALKIVSGAGLPAMRADSTAQPLKCVYILKPYA